MRIANLFYSSFFVVFVFSAARANPGGFSVKVEPVVHFTHVIDEPVDVRVTIRNLTGQPFRTAAGDRFHCAVERYARDRAVARYEDAEMPEVELQPGETWQGQIRLTDMFKMRLEGDYFIKADVANRQGSGSSDGTVITLSPGQPILLKDGRPAQARQMFSDGTQREFRLVYLQNYQVCEYLYLRIIDPDNVRAWDTLSLGVIFRSEEPKLDIQNDGTVTILHRASQELHMKTTLASSREEVRVTGYEELFDPEAIARFLLDPFIKKAMEPPPPKKSWWKLW